MALCKKMVPALRWKQGQGFPSCFELQNNFTPQYTLLIRILSADSIWQSCQCMKTVQRGSQVGYKNWFDLMMFIRKKLFAVGLQAIMRLCASESPIIWQHPNCQKINFFQTTNPPLIPFLLTICQMPWKSSSTNKDLSSTLRIDLRLIFYTPKSDLSQLFLSLSCPLAVISQLVISSAEMMNRKCLLLAQQISAALNLLAGEQPLTRSHVFFSYLHITILLRLISKTLSLNYLITMRSVERYFLFSKNQVSTVRIWFELSIEMKKPLPSLVSTKILLLMISNYSMMFYCSSNVVSFQYTFYCLFSDVLPFDSLSYFNKKVPIMICSLP